MEIKKATSHLMLVLVFLCVFSRSSLAQQEKGDIEITAFSSGFRLSFGGGLKPARFSGSGVLFTSERFQSFNLGGEAGYFLTRKSEIGGGLDFSAIHFSDCRTTFSDGQITGESCEGDGSAHLGISGFYRYNFAKPGAKGFPFVGGTFSVADVANNFTGNFRARPHAGYKSSSTKMSQGILASAIHLT